MAVKEKGTYIDIRYMRSFLEHKQLMLMRLTFLAEQRYIMESDRSAYEQIEQQAKILYAKSLKYDYTKEGSLIDSIAHSMREIISQEGRLLSRVITALKQAENTAEART